MIFTSTVALIWMVYKENGCLIIGSEESIRCIISFLMGLLLYELYEKISNQQGKVISYVFMAVFIGTVIVFGYLQKISRTNIGDVIPWIVIFLFCPLILYLAIYIEPVKHLFSGCVLQFIGKISMDIYMWHWVVRIYLGSRPFYLEQETWSGWIVLLIAALTVSILSHYIFMPMIYSISAKKNNSFR